ncbi:MAG: hypothetical protein Q7U10_01375 [Thermodesulfovibrionia bacterium]|nr:hypothetical protein [Thermodesulfovibrionia bacterium]
MTTKEALTKSVKIANGIFLVGALVCLFVLLFVLWKSNFTLDKVITKQIIAPIICLILFLSALKLKAKIKVNVTLILISLILSLYAFEIFIYLWVPKNRIDIVKDAKEAGISFDRRTKLQVLHDLRKNGVNAYPIVFPSRLLPKGLKPDFYFLGNISKATTILCNEGGEYVIYLSDKYGFNNPPDSWETGQPDLMMVGDSFVQGICVKPGEDMTGQLRKLGWNGLNVGMGGNGPLFELATLKEYVEPMRPKNVLWVYYEDNDLIDFQKEKESTILLKYMQNDFLQNLINRQEEIDNILRDYIKKEIENENNNYRTQNKLLNFLRLSHIQTMLIRFNKGAETETISTPQPDLLFQEILKQARDRVSQWGGNLYFVYLPHFQRYSKNADYDKLRHRQDVLSIARKLEIPIIDLHEEVLAKHKDPLSLIPLRLYGHYNAEGYKLFAEAIDRHLKQK